MDEYLEGGNNYFLRLIWNRIYDYTEEIVCMSFSTIASIKKKFK